MEVLSRMQPYRTMTTILSEHSRGISNSLTLSNHFIVLKMTETYSVSTLQAVQLTLTKHFSVFYTSKQETQAGIHIYRTRPLWKCTENPDDSLHHAPIKPNKTNNLAERRRIIHILKQSK